MWGDHVINTDDKMTDMVNNDPNSAVKNLKDVLTAVKYHKIPAINTILVRQVGRVGSMMEQMEVFLEGRNDIAYGRKGNLLRYQRAGLKLKWEIFMQKKVTLARSKASTHLTTWLQSLQNAYASATDRANAVAGSDDAILIAKIDALDAAITAEGAWVLPTF